MIVEWKSADLRAWKRSLGWERWDLFCDSKLESVENSRLLREVLGIDSLSSERAVSSHSLKATGLSWAAKYGLAAPDRSVLGRHASAVAESEAVYSRDLAMGPVMRFQQCSMKLPLAPFGPMLAEVNIFRSGNRQQVPTPMVYLRWSWRQCHNWLMLLVHNLFPPTVRALTLTRQLPSRIGG